MLEPLYGEQIFKDRYALTEDETWEQACKRMGVSIAQAENGNKEYWAEKFASIIYDGYFIPGGRIIRNAGRPRCNMLNCYGLVCEDSIESIGKTLYDALVIQSEGGGIGVNFNLRPKGAPIKRKGGVSSGVVSFVKLFNYITNVIETGGSRRGAMLAMLRIDHPDVSDFIYAKSEAGELENLNISVAITNEFIDSVIKDKEWTLHFGGKVYKTVKAKDLWFQIIENMIKHAEPGILNISNMQINNSYYCAPIETTNACSEIPLERYGACLLGALVLPKFVRSDGKTNWKLLEEVINIAVRFLDDVLDITAYPLPETLSAVLNVRRMGLGTMGLADYLFVKKIKYGSYECLKEIDRLYSTIQQMAYDASIKLAEEKTSFPKYDPIALCDSKIIRRLPRFIQHGIKNIGLRNIALTSAQPTGTTSLLVGVTSGIEPLFAKGYLRKDRISERVYIHPLTRKYAGDNNELPDWFVSAEDITPDEHLEAQVTVQRYLDGSISKTINFPETVNVEAMSNVLLKYVKDLKGVTVYVDKSREDQVLFYLNREKIMEYLKNESVEIGKEERDCKAGTCEL